MAISDRIDPYLRQLVNHVMFSGKDEKDSIDEYWKGYLENMERQRQIVLMSLVAKLYEGKWGKLESEFSLAVLLSSCDYQYDRRWRGVCLLMLVDGVRRFYHDNDIAELYEFIGNLCPDTFADEELPFI